MKHATILIFLSALAGILRADELPIQMETGGGDTSPPAVNPPGKYANFPVEVEKAEGMKVYSFIPDGLAPGKKYPVLFVFHGNGDGPEGRLRNLSNVSSKEFPIFCFAIQYQKEAKMGAEGWPPGTLTKACTWLLPKVLKDHPIDPDQIHLQGFSMGGGPVGNWAYNWWKTDKENFPFRALFFSSTMASTHVKDQYPPIPFICMVGEKETAVLGSINVVEDVRDFCNELTRFGIENEYHEIPGMEHSVNERCHRIIRDTIIALAAPPLPYETGDIAKIISLLKRGRWKEGMEALKPLEAKDTEEKLRKKAIEVRKAMEQWATAELKRLERVVAEALAKRKWFDVEAYVRMRAISDAFPDQGKAFVDKLKNLERKQADEIKRREDYLAARIGEEKDPAASKIVYQELAKAKDSRTAKAAQYRLTWWMDKRAAGR